MVNTRGRVNARGRALLPAEEEYCLKSFFIAEEEGRKKNKNTSDCKLGRCVAILELTHCSSLLLLPPEKQAKCCNDHI